MRTITHPLEPARAVYVAPATDRLPHEPLRVRWSAGPFAVRLVVKALSVAVIGLVGAPLWPVFALGCGVFGWPPHVPRLGQFARYFGWVVRAAPPDPGIAPLSRAYLFVHLGQRFWLVPLAGLAWFLDEVLFRRRLARHPVREPLILLSAARSGSTQISRYLEEDPRLAVPSTLQALLPYLWLWHLARPLGRWLTPDRLRRWTLRFMPEEFVQRHEVDPLRTDTFEVLFFTLKLNSLSPCFGPDALAADLAFSSRAPHNRAMWDRDFVDFVDGLGRRVLAFAGPMPDGSPRRFYFKGHFQPADDALARRFPDAHFITVVRDPVKRIRSAINHVHGSPVFETLGAVPWAWLAAALPDTEVAYCQREMDWYTRPDGPRRTVIRFRAYVDDLEGTMRHVYARCFGEDALPGHVPRTHAPRDRTAYRVDRDLVGLGVGTDAIASALSSYRAWVTGSKSDANRGGTGGASGVVSSAVPGSRSGSAWEVGAGVSFSTASRGALRHPDTASASNDARRDSRMSMRTTWSRVRRSEIKRARENEVEPTPASPRDRECPFCAMTIPRRAMRCPECTSHLDDPSVGD